LRGSRGLLDRLDRLAVARGDQFLSGSSSASSGVMAGISRFGAGLPPAYMALAFGGAGDSARASISDEPAEDVAQPPSARLNASSAAAAGAVIRL